MFCALNIVPKKLDMTSNIQIFIFFNKRHIIWCSRKGVSINSFTVNMTGYCRFHDRFAGHIHKRLQTAGRIIWSAAARMVGLWG
jgi:hypothetical protein